MKTEDSQDPPVDGSDDIKFPIVIKLLKPLELKDSDGNVIDRIEACIIDREPEYGELKKVRRAPVSDHLEKLIGLVTNIQGPMIERLGARDIARIEKKLMVFFGE